VSELVAFESAKSANTIRCSFTVLPNW